MRRRRNVVNKGIRFFSLLLAEGVVQSQGGACGICCGQHDTWQFVSRVLQFYSVSYYSTIALSPGVVQRRTCGPGTKGQRCPHPTARIMVCYLAVTPFVFMP
jgi:hypothetical protein